MKTYGLILSLLLTTFLCTRASAQMNSKQEILATFPAQQEWLDKWDNSLAYTLEALMAANEEDLDFRPTEGQMTLREQFQHLATNVYMLTTRFIDKPEGFDLAKLREEMSEADDKETIAGIITKAYFFGAIAARSLNEDNWDDPAPEFFAGEKTKRAILYLIQDHATHHRAQTLVYLRMLGHKPPSYRGW